MAAVTSNQLIKRQEGKKKSYPVAASTRIYQGTHVFANAAGYADDDHNSGANEYAGIAIGEQDNSSGSNGDLNVEVWSEGVFEVTGSGFAQTDVGENAYAANNFDVTQTVTDVLIGVFVEFISSTKMMVRLQPKPARGATIADPAGGGTVDAEARTAINALIDRLQELDLIV